MTETVLLLDGRAISTLAAARQLDRAGKTVHVAESFSPFLTAYSGATTATHQYPAAEDHPTAFERSVRMLAEDIDADVVIPARDATTRHLAGIADTLPAGTETLLGTPEQIDSLHDKRLCADLARSADIPIPATYDPRRLSAEEIRDQASYPVVLKPTRTSGARGIRRAETPDELATLLDQHPDLLVQEYIDHAGGHYSIGTVFGPDGTATAVHVYEELRQYPDSGGPAIRARSIPVEPWVEELLGLLEAIDWTGPAHMDVLFDPAEETYKLLEVNPRLWSSLALSTGAGVDVSGAIVEGAMDRDPGPPGSYDTDLGYRWTLPNELLWAADGWATPRRIASVLRPAREPTVYSILSRADPGATLGAILQSGRFLLDSERRTQVLQRSGHQPQH